MKSIAVIPARYNSSRFPGKPLALLAGKPVIWHVYNNAARVFDFVVVATDDMRIFQAVTDFGGRAVLTSPSHPSGTSRVAEALDILGVEAQVVVNVQGDEPFLSPDDMSRLVECFADPNTDIATLACRFRPEWGFDVLADPNRPKVVVDSADFALFFSRAVVPFVRGCDPQMAMVAFPYLLHVGVYAFRPEVLRSVAGLPSSPLVDAESLEQLNWLYFGKKIKVAYADAPTIGIDTPADLLAANSYISSHPLTSNQ